MFSFVDAVLLKPLPYPHAEELMEVFERSPRDTRASASTLNYLDWKTQNTVFAALAAQATAAVTLTGLDEPVQVQSGRVTSPFLEMFGLKPVLGRGFLPEEEQPGQDRVAILSHRLWESRFGSDRGVLGRTLTLDGAAYTVVGVLPAGGPFEKGLYDLWTPLAFEPKDQTRSVRWLRVWARLKPGVSLEQANLQMSSVAGRMQQEYPESNKGWGVTLVRLVDDVTTHTMRRSLIVLLGAVAGVLLIACANLANLLLVRGAARERELAIRAAMGAGRGRLVAQFLMESLLLATGGGVLGVGAAYGFIAALKAWIPPRVLPPEAEVSLDLRVLAFTAAVAVVTGILFGIGPALAAVRGDLAESLKETGIRATASVGRRRLRDLLVVVEVALAFVLLTGAGLLLRSFYELLQVDPGIETSNVVTLALPMAPERYPDGPRIAAYLTQVQERIAAVPGVRAVATASVLPFQGWGWEMPFQVEGQPAVDRASRPTCFFKVVSPTYFSALGMKLREGRGLSETDTAGTPLAMVINESMAQRYFSEAPAVGARAFLPQIVAGQRRGPEVAWQVVGVVNDEKVKSLQDSSPGVYVSYRQSPVLGVSLVVRGALDPSRLVKAIERAVRELNPAQPVADVRMLEELKSLSLGSNRLSTALLGIFAGLALLLAAIGIYGVLSYSVAQRTQEMGIRAALGATRRDQIRLVLGGGLFLTGFGIALGVFSSLALTRVMESLLFEVSPRDPWTLVAVGVVLVTVAAVACFAPARRATLVDPVVALRHQ